MSPRPCASGRSSPLLFPYVRAGLLLLLSSTVSLDAASSLRVDRRTVRAGGTLDIVLELEGDSAKVPEVDLPVSNLTIGNPSVSTEFSWVNGRTTRRKIFRWSATPQSSGRASVGPVTIRTARGGVQQFDAVFIDVTPAPAPPANEREAVSRIDEEQPIVVVAEIDKSTALVGEQRVVSWWVYTRSAIRSVRVSSRPTFADFWIEEIPLDEQAEPEASLAGSRVSRYLVRRTALFPVRAGELEIPPLGVTAAVLEAIDSPHDPFGLNHRLVESRAESQILHLSVVEPPGGASIVGNVMMSCSRPVVPASGPVVFDVSLRGDANLRTAEPPVPDEAVPGRLEWIDLGSTADTSTGRVQMIRRWRAAIYPAESGSLNIPRLTLGIFEPGSGSRTLACDAMTVVAQFASGAAPAGTAPPPDVRPRSRIMPMILAIAATLALLTVIGALMFRYRRRTNSRVSAIVTELHDEDARLMRAKIDSYLASYGLNRAFLLRDTSEVAEEFRALEAAIDLRAREPWRQPELDLQMREQLRRFVEALQSS